MKDSQRKSIDNIKALTLHPDFNLYSMNAEYEYSIDEIIENFTGYESKYTSQQVEVDTYAAKAVADHLEVKISDNAKLHPFGCTAFKVRSTDGNVLMARNYDFRTDSSGMLIYCNPNKKWGSQTSGMEYRSVAFAPFPNMLDSIEKEEDILLMPFSCVDGINECGVSIAVLVTTNQSRSYPTYQKSLKSNIFTTLAVRLVLDRANTTEAAVNLIKKYDMFALSCKDYHFFINDSKGTSVVVEYDYESSTRDIIVTNTDIVTNFYLYDKKEHKHGYNRYKTIKKFLDNSKIEKNEKNIWRQLEDTSQESSETDTSNTQWSVIYNSTQYRGEGVFHQEWNNKISLLKK